MGKRLVDEIIEHGEAYKQKSGRWAEKIGVDVLGTALELARTLDLEGIRKYDSGIESIDYGQDKKIGGSDDKDQDSYWLSMGGEGGAVDLVMEAGRMRGGRKRNAVNMRIRSYFGERLDTTSEGRDIYVREEDLMDLIKNEPKLTAPVKRRTRY